MEVNAYKTVLDVLNEGKDFNVIFNCKILTAIKEELMKEECNRKKLILFSGHDDNLSVVIKRLELIIRIRSLIMILMMKLILCVLKKGMNIMLKCFIMMSYCLIRCVIHISVR